MSEPDHLVRCDGRQGRIEARVILYPVAAIVRWVVPGGTLMAAIESPRETSIRAFYHAINSGKLDNLRHHVYVALREIPRSTVSEVWAHMRAHHHLGGFKDATSPRMAELRDDGLIRETEKRPCRITGQTCITWEIVPEPEHRGLATIIRCPTCGHIIERLVPIGGDRVGQAR